MDKEKRPKHLAQLQALAAIGQCRLMNIWDSLFNHLKQPVAQILLTRNDIADVSFDLRSFILWLSQCYNVLCREGEKVGLLTFIYSARGI